MSKLSLELLEAQKDRKDRQEMGFAKRVKKARVMADYNQKILAGFGAVGLTQASISHDEEETDKGELNE